jgi:hypothetical protein
MKTPEQIAEQNGWDGYASIVDQRDIADIQKDAWNEALEVAARKVKALSHGLDCSCDGCVARGNDVVTILEQRIAEPSNDRTERPGPL